MPYGKMYHLITDDIHTAMNYGLHPRLHLIFSTYVNDEIQQILEDNESKTVVKDQQENFSTGMHTKSLLQLMKIAYHNDGNTNICIRNYADQLKKINTDNDKDGS